MANIKDLKKKIKSTKGTLKITTAMKLVSAAKLSKAQQAITQSRPYSEELQETIKIISALVENYAHDYIVPKKDNNHSALLVISSNKGLCGGYNSQLAKAVRNFVNEKSVDENFKVYFSGNKVKEIIGKEFNVGKEFTFESSQLSYQEIKSMALELSNLFLTSEFGKVYVAYNKFNSAISFTPMIKQVLPFELSEEKKKELQGKFPFDFKYDPGPKEILDKLIPEVYLTALYTYYLDAVAAEHGSRMAAMDSAVSNCKEMVKTLTLKMNKIRQASITTELIEVISGAESLNN